MSTQVQPPSTLAKGAVKLSGAHETLLTTLFGRLVDAQSPNPILNDQHAVTVVERIRSRAGYDFGRTTLGASNGAAMARSVATRARIMDIATEQFLARHPGPATVLHLACGMDARSLRVRWQGPGRVWVDVDVADAVNLRREVMDEPSTIAKDGGGCEYRLLEENITDDGWLERLDVPADRPVFVVFEGLTPYLTPEEVYGLLQTIVGYFSARGVRGEIRFDCVGPVMYFLINYVFNAALKKMGTRFKFCLSNPAVLEREVPGLLFRNRLFKMQDYARLGRKEEDGATLGALLVGWLLWVMDFFEIGALFGGDYGYEF